MIAHQKHVVQKVSENRELFKKELYKSLAWLKEEDLDKLVTWLKENYWETHSSEISAVFSNYMVVNNQQFIYKELNT